MAMTEPMTLMDVRKWHAEGYQACLDNGYPEAALKHKRMADTIDAHLAQQAQAVDVETIREVIASHIDEAKKLNHDPESQDYLYEQADKLERALPAAPRKESQGMGVLAIKFTSPYSLPAFPMPDKEG